MFYTYKISVAMVSWLLGNHDYTSTTFKGTLRRHKGVLPNTKSFCKLLAMSLSIKLIVTK